MEDGPQSIRTTADRLSILRRPQNAWNWFSYTTKEGCNITEICMDPAQNSLVLMENFEDE